VVLAQAKALGQTSLISKRIHKSKPLILMAKSKTSLSLLLEKRQPRAPYKIVVAAASQPSPSRLGDG